MHGRAPPAPRPASSGKARPAFPDDDSRLPDAPVAPGRAGPIRRILPRRPLVGAIDVALRPAKGAATTAGGRLPRGELDGASPSLLPLRRRSSRESQAGPTRRRDHLPPEAGDGVRGQGRRAARRAGDVGDLLSRDRRRCPADAAASARGRDPTRALRPPCHEAAVSPQPKIRTRSGGRGGREGADAAEEERRRGRAKPLAPRPMSRARRSQALRPTRWWRRATAEDPDAPLRTSRARRSRRGGRAGPNESGASRPTRWARRS